MVEAIDGLPRDDIASISCKYCKNNGFNILIESKKIDDWIIGWDVEMLATSLEQLDNSVVMDIRNGCGYLRIGDREEMQGLDTEDKVNIKFCPFCGRKFKEVMK